MYNCNPDADVVNGIICTCIHRVYGIYYIIKKKERGRKKQDKTYIYIQQKEKKKKKKTHTH